MQKAPSKSKNASARMSTRSRKPGRTTFDKSGRGIWEWQTATGVFEQHITDQQLADLEDSKLTFLEERVQEQEPGAVSYFEFLEQTKSKAPATVSKPTENSRGPITRLFARFSRKV